MALFSGRIVRVLVKNQKTDSHDLLLQIEDKLNSLTVDMVSVFDDLEKSLSSRERYILLGLSHKYNDDNSKVVVSARSYQTSNACFLTDIPTLESVVSFMHLINCTLRNI